MERRGYENEEKAIPRKSVPRSPLAFANLTSKVPMAMAVFCDCWELRVGMNKKWGVGMGLYSCQVGWPVKQADGRRWPRMLMAIVFLKISKLRLLFFKSSNGKDAMRLGFAKEQSYELLNFDGFAIPLH